MSAMLRYPLKQSFIEYFQLNQIDNTVYHSQLHEYLVKKIMESPNPQERALEIWDKFVLHDEDDTIDPYVKTRIKEYTEDIYKHNDVHYTINVIGCVGVSPFCYTRAIRTGGGV